MTTVMVTSSLYNYNYDYYFWYCNKFSNEYDIVCNVFTHCKSEKGAYFAWENSVQGRCAQEMGRMEWHVHSILPLQDTMEWKSIPFCPWRAIWHVGKNGMLHWLSPFCNPPKYKPSVKVETGINPIYILHFAAGEITQLITLVLHHTARYRYIEDISIFIILHMKAVILCWTNLTQT